METTEALIVGAGPVGMATALMLVEQNVKPVVLDAAGGTAGHSYACALHACSLKLLERFGLLEEVLQWGWRVNTLAFYEGASRRTEVHFSKLHAPFPFLVVLPQNALEWMLERTLNRLNIQVNWRHRLADLQLQDAGIVATVDRLEDNSQSAVETEPVLEQRLQFTTSLLVGADGSHSAVRRCLGIPYARFGEPEYFMFFEFDTDIELDHEVRVVFGQSTADVLWPISQHRCRWSFQVEKNGFGLDLKRSAARRGLPADEDRQFLQRLILERAPWFTGKIQTIHWLSYALFERRLSRSLSDGRFWLVGDAAHQTGPVGVQSLNIGLREADDLTRTLRSGAKANASEDWNQRWQAEWHQLLGINGSLQPTAHADGWVSRRAEQILECCPASGRELADLLSQLQLARP